jgi:phospholipid-binding lipoprotein MlaA
MYGFNESLDEAVVKPVATAYKESLPEIVQIGVRNFFSNLEDIFIGVNNLLQGKPVEAASDWTRVALNTVFGGVGLLDWASEIGLEKHNEDFGQTFGRWGVGDGPYLVWPVLGSSTLRDTAGRIIDIRGRSAAQSQANCDPQRTDPHEWHKRRAYLLDASRLLEEGGLGQVRIPARRSSAAPTQSDS